MQQISASLQRETPKGEVIEQVEHINWTERRLYSELIQTLATRVVLLVV
jgi:hypothetical protein